MLATLAQIKASLGIPDSDTTYDAFLTEQIEILSFAIEDYCQRKFLTADYIQTFYREDIRLMRKIQLYHYPASEIESVEVDGVERDEATFRLHKPSASVIALDGTNFCADEVVVTFTAGYDECPPPIYSALVSLVSDRLSKKKAGVDMNFGSDVQRISIPGTISIDFDYSLSNNDRGTTYGAILGNYLNVFDSWRAARALLSPARLEYVEDVPEGP